MVIEIMPKMLRNLFISLFLLFSFGNAQAYVSFSSSVTAGVYRDDQLNNHVPVFYNLSYSGLHSNGSESSLDLILNNDLYDNKWTVIPSNAVITLPLPESFQHANGRRSRLAAGRQLFAEGFDLTILDGAQLPIYWSSYGGVWLYGGSSHVMDLADSTAIPLAGGNIFQEVEGFHLKAGFSSRQNTSTQQVYYGSVHREFESLPLSPALLTKAEFDQTSSSVAQTLTELDLNPMNAVTIYGIHSYRNPRPTTTNRRFFIYQTLSNSAQETVQGGAKIEFFDHLFLQGFGRTMRYNSGQVMETGSQQELSLTWMLNDYHSFTPVFGHILGYGGELWDTGLTYRAKLTDTASWQTDLAAARLSKVNGITGWAYQVRNGMDWLLASRWTTSLWAEVERNHLFEFDARLIAHVTYFH